MFRGQVFDEFLDPAPNAMSRVKILLPNSNNSFLQNFRMQFSNDRPFSNLIFKEKQHSK